MYVKFLVLAAGQTKAIAPVVLETVPDQEMLIGKSHISDKLRMWKTVELWRSSFASCFAGKHQTDELEKMKLLMRMTLVRPGEGMP